MSRRRKSTKKEATQAPKKEAPSPNRKWILVIIALVVVIFLAFTFNSGEDTSSKNIPLAQCMTEAGATMYGAYWCPHCKKQKEEILGLKAFAYIDYVECATGGPSDIPAQPGLCSEKNIESYPTWIFADGSRLVGEQDLATLAAKTGCTQSLAQ